MLAALAIVAAAPAAAQVSPAADLAACGPMTETARRIFADVLVRSLLVGGGREIAAFAVATRGEDLECALWPRHGSVHEETFYGMIPPATVALVHSHPNGAAAPSRADVEVARRLRLPVYSVTRTEVWVVDVEGTTRNLVRERLWASGVHPSVCRDPSPVESR